MKSNRLKWIFIVLLLIADLSLAGYIFYNDGIRARELSAYVENAVNAMEENGVGISAALLSGAEKQIPLYLLVPSERFTDEEYARLFFGENDPYTRFQTPDGTAFISEHASLKMTDSMSFEYTLSETTRAVPEMRSASDPKKAAEMKDLAAPYFRYSGGTGFTVREYAETEDGLFIGAGMEIGGIEISGMNSVFCFQDGALVYAGGSILFSGSLKPYSFDRIDRVNCVLALRGRDIETISALDIAYRVKRAGDNNIYILPFYRVGTDRGDFRVDMLSGNIF